MKIGYARVSTRDQDLSLQIDALQKAGCKQIYQEKASGKHADRPELQQMLLHLRAGDQVIVWKLDRIGRSLKNLLDIVEHLKKHQVDFISLNDHIDTSTPTGRFTFNLFAALAEFEREMIVERTRAGLDAARKRGNAPGRKKGLSPEAQITAERARKLHKESNLSVEEIAKLLKIGKSTMYRYVKQK